MSFDKMVAEVVLLKELYPVTPVEHHSSGRTHAKEHSCYQYDFC